MADADRGRSPRPQSTIAQNFAADLDSMFGLSPTVEGLSQTVEEKKQTINSGAAELQELEARLRATEERLARASRNSSPARVTAQANVGAARDPPVSQPYANDIGKPAVKTSPLAQKPSYPSDRPPTSDAPARPLNAREDTQTLMSGMPGAMPPSPSPVSRHYSGSSDFIMVDRQTDRSVV